MSLARLPGTSDGKHWSFRDANKPGFDPGRAIFAIARVDSTDVHLIGSGFYIFPNGVFITAKHVAIEVLEIGIDLVKIIHLLPDHQYILRQISGFDLHDSSDICVGRPIIINDKDGNEHRGKVVPLDLSIPSSSTPISTWAYPRHKIEKGDLGVNVVLEPDFYDGRVIEYFINRGPSGRLTPPYFLTDIFLHGAASGGPIFDTSGRAIGVASSSYDGAENVSFVTPMQTLLDIQIDMQQGEGNSSVRIRFGDFAAKTNLFAGQ